MTIGINNTMGCKAAVPCCAVLLCAVRAGVAAPCVRQRRDMGCLPDCRGASEWHTDNKRRLSDCRLQVRLYERVYMSSVCACNLTGLFCMYRRMDGPGVIPDPGGRWPQLTDSDVAVRVMW